MTTQTYLLAEHVLPRTLQLLRTFGTPEEPHEGVVLWGGLRVRELTIITTCVVPNPVTTPGSFRIPHAESLRVGTCFREAGVHYVAQVHSHPFECGVGHSWGDDEQAYLKHEGLLSIVVRDYAQPDDALDPLTNAGIHRFEDGTFRWMSSQEVRAAFRPIPKEIDLRLMAERAASMPMPRRRPKK